MKKHCLVLLALVLVFTLVFSASASAAGEPDRLQLTERTIIYYNRPITQTMVKPYETWFLDSGSIYAVTVKLSDPMAIEGRLFTYTAGTDEDGNQTFALEGGALKGETVVVKDGKAGITLKDGSGAYGFEVIPNKTPFSVDATFTQNGSYIDFTWEAKNANGACVFHYDIFNSKDEPVLSGHTTETGLHFQPNADDTYRFYLSAMDQDLDISEYIVKTVPFADHPELVIENGVVTGYKGTDSAVVVPASFNGVPITGIGANAFANVKTLERIELPVTIEEVSPNAFTGCSAKIFCDRASLTAQTLSGQRQVFYDNSDVNGDFALLYMMVNNESTLALYSYSGTDKSVTIPDHVQYIYNNAFKDNRTMTAVTIPANVTGIGTNAFSGCIRLADVSFESGSKLTAVGANAFFGCGALKTLTLPAGLTTIGDGAFADCSALEKLVLESKAISSIGQNAFFNCHADIYCQNLDADNVTLETVTKLVRNFYYEQDELTLGLRFEEDGAGERGLVLYSCTGMGPKLEIPAMVKTIAADTFKGNKWLNEVSVASGSKLMGIGDNAFQDCIKLSKLDLTKAAALEDIGDYAFDNCSGLTVNQTLPDSVKHIGTRAFCNCTGLDSITIPDDIETIGPNAFFNGPKKVYCDREKDSAKVVSAMPFTFYVKAADAFGLRWENEDLVLYAYDGPADVTVPAYITGIQADAFKDSKTALTKVTIPASVKTISTGTFDGFDKLTEINVANSTALEDKAIQNCQSLEKVNGLKDLNVIDTNFDNCPQLLLDMPFDSVRLALGVDFAEKAKIGGVTLPDTLSTVGKVASFDSGAVVAHAPGTTKIYLYEGGKIGICEVEVLSGLTGLKLPAALTEIEEEAFAENGAEFAALPGSVTKIGSRAFAKDAGLKLINIPNGAALGSDVFDGSDDVVVVIDSADTANQTWYEANDIDFQYAG